MDRKANAFLRQAYRSVVTKQFSNWSLLQSTPMVMNVG